MTISKLLGNKVIRQHYTLNRRTSMENLSENYGTLQPRRSFALDISKVETFEDMKKIFGALGLRLYEATPQYEELKDYFIMDEFVEEPQKVINPEVLESAEVPE